MLMEVDKGSDIDPQDSGCPKVEKGSCYFTRLVHLIVNPLTGHKDKHKNSNDEK
jgi:hypothetical protein